MAQKNIQKVQKTFYDDSYLKYVLYFLLALFVYVFFVNAWVGDDAYITFRTVDNFVNGYGLTWNTSERVQAYTHPLWMFIHSFFYAITGNIYYTTMFLSFAFSFLAVWLLVYKFAANKLMAIAGLILLLISKTFIDYTSSGLENPLTYFLLILFLMFYFNKDEAQKKLFKLSLITALLMLNRMDLVLLVIPALIYLLVKNWKAKHLFYVFYGFIPLILWEIFSIIYYGFPFPNTYYAKLNTGIPFGEYISQGFQYYYAQLNYDPITLIIFLASIIFSIYINTKRKDYVKEFIIFLGVFLYLLYILRIGGDFMCGRFFAVPLFLSIIVLTHIDFRNFGISNKIIPFVLLFLTTFMFIFTREPALLTTINYGSGFSKYKNDNDKIWEQLYRATGVADEKKFYYSKSGLLTMLFNSRSTPDIIEIKQALGSKKSNYNNFIRGYIGYFGYYLGQKNDIIDNLALSDPLLARLNSSKDPNWTISNWRIGHFYRRIPLGYLETKNTGENQLENKNLLEYYDKLKIITQSAIFSSGRMSEIFRFNIGFYDDLIDNDYQEFDEPKINSGDVESIRIYNLRMGNDYFSKTYYRLALNYYLELLNEEKWIKYTDIRSKLYQKAVEIYSKLQKPDSAIYFATKGFLSAQDNNFAKYFTNFIYKFHKGKKDFVRAMSILEHYLSNFPNEIEILNNKADCLVAIGRPDNAVGIWNKIIQLNPNYGNAYYNLFTYYFSRNKYPLASYFAFKAVENGEPVAPEHLEFLKKYKH